MYPAGFVAKHQAPIDERGRSPDRCLRAISPNHFARVCGQAIEVTVARADVYSAIRHNRACPEAALLFARAAFGFVLPNKLTVALPEAIDVTIFGGSVNLAFVNSRSRI